MAVTDAVFYSQYPIDNVIAVHSGSMTIPIRTDPPNTTVISTNISNQTFFQGIFLTDTDTLYNDIGGYKFVDDGLGVFTRYGLEAYSQNGSITLRSRTNDTNTHTANYKIALITKPDQGIVPPTAATISEYFYSGRNYQKIAVDNVKPVTVGTGVSVTTVAHNLGYKPCSRPFVDVSGVLYDALATPILATSGFFTATVEVYVDTANVYVNFINDTGSPFDVILYTRIYYDPS